MNNERENKKLTTPVDKHEVVIKSWLTGREKRLIQSVYLDEVTFGGKEYQVKGELLTKAQDAALLQLIVSVNGDPKDILEKLLDFRSEDFDFVVAEINKITNPEIDVKK